MTDKYKEALEYFRRQEEAWRNYDEGVFYQTAIAALTRAEKMEKALRVADKCLKRLPVIAYEIGLAGTPDADKLFGGVDLFRVIDTVSEALNEQEERS